MSNFVQNVSLRELLANWEPLDIEFPNVSAALLPLNHVSLQLPFVPADGRCQRVSASEDWTVEPRTVD